MKEFLITVLCVCSVSSFRIAPVRSVEIITEGTKTEAQAFTNQPIIVALPLVPTSVLSTDSRSPTLSNTVTETSSLPDTTIESRSFSNSSPWSISNFVNPADSRPDKIAPSSKGSLGTAQVPVTTIATIKQPESPRLSNATATSSFVTTTTNTEQSNSLIVPPAMSLSQSTEASSTFKVSEITTPTESATIQSDPVSSSVITEDLSASTEAPLLSSSKSDNTTTSNKDSEVTTPITFKSNAASTTLKDSKVTTPFTSTERATTQSESVSSSTTTELSSSASEQSPETSSLKSDTTTTNLKDSEANPNTTDSVAKQSELVSTDSSKSEPSASNLLSAIKDESSLTEKTGSVLSSTSSESASTGSEKPTTESIIIVETTTQDLSFLSLNLLPPKKEYRKNEPDPRYDY